MDSGWTTTPAQTFDLNLFTNVVPVCPIIYTLSRVDGSNLPSYISLDSSSGELSVSYFTASEADAHQTKSYRLSAKASLTSERISAEDFDITTVVVCDNEGPNIV